MDNKRSDSRLGFVAAITIILLVALVGVFILGVTVLAGDVAPTPVPTVSPAPTIALAPNAAEAGTLVVVNGSGWSAGSTVLVRMEPAAGAGNASTALASAIVADDGSFSTRFVFPAEAEWTRLPGVLVVAWNPADVAQEARAVLAVLSQPVETPEPAPAPTPEPVPVPAITDWRGEYFVGTVLAGAPLVVRNDVAVDFNWASVAPAPGLAADQFSVRWTRAMAFDDALYRFHVVVDDGVRLYVDDALVIDAWQDGSARELTAERLLTAGPHALRLEYYDRAGQAEVRLWWEKVGAYPDWKGEYWSNFSLAGNPALVRNDATLDFAWGVGSPAAEVPADNFSARWSRTVSFDAGTYRFSVRADDGVRLYVDGQRFINEWHISSGEQAYTVDLLLEGNHTLRVDYYEGDGQALVGVSWARVGGNVPANRAPLAADDAVTLAVLPSGALMAAQSVTLNVLANDSDPDGDGLSLLSYSATSALGGAVTCTVEGLCTYTPVAGFLGVDGFSYMVSDARGGTDSADVTVTVVSAGS